jgi:hypothetical protein
MAWGVGRRAWGGERRQENGERRQERLDQVKEEGKCSGTNRQLPEASRQQPVANCQLKHVQLS